MLAKIKKKKCNKLDNRCLSCGTTANIKQRRYCTLKCRQDLRQKLNSRTGLLIALNARYAAFYFSDTIITMDVVPCGIKEVFRYEVLRKNGNKPADDFGRITNLLGRAWWEEEKRTNKHYLASRKILEMASRHPMTAALMRPRLIRIPDVKMENLKLLDLSKADLASSELHRIIKNAYRNKVKIHHPDAGGKASVFRQIHAAYKEMLIWADHPRFTRRRGYVDKWYYDGDSRKWVQPVAARR